MGGGQSTAHSSTICFYYTTINFFCQVFYTTFLELFLIFCYSFLEGTLCRPKVPFHPPRALARLRRSNSCFKQKGILYLRESTFSVGIRDFGSLICYRKRYSPIERVIFLLPNYSTYQRYSLLFSFSPLQACFA